MAAELTNSDSAAATEALALVQRIALMHWDGEEKEDGTEAELSGDETHDALVDLIQQARDIVASPER